MNVGVYGKTGQPFVGQDVEAIMAGLAAVGHRPILQNPAGFHGPADVDSRFNAVAVVGFRDKSREIVEAYRTRDVHAIVIEQGHLWREKGYRQLSIDSLNWLPPTGAVGGSRWQSFGVKFSERKKAQKGHILVLGQVPGDAQHPMVSLSLAKEWILETIKELRRHSKREIVYRPHPKVLETMRDGPIVRPEGADRISDPRAITLEDDLAGAWAAVTYNSTAGHTALLAGVPVFCSPNAIYADIANTDFKDLKAPQMGNRGEFYRRLAYTIWTREEIREGVFWDTLQPFLEAGDGVLSGHRPAEDPPEHNEPAPDGATRLEQPED